MSLIPHRFAFRWPLVAACAVALGLAACATPSQQAQSLLRSGDAQGAVALLEQAQREQPRDESLRVGLLRARQALAGQWVVQIDLARARGQWDRAQGLLERLAALDPQHPRLPTLTQELERAQRSSRSAAAAPRPTAPVAAPAPAATASPPRPSTLAEAYQKPVSLEFRDAPLRSVFEALARAGNVNFVFDKDVRGDGKVTVFLRDVTLDEAVRVVLATQALERKLLNDSTVMIFPNTQAKQREHQELVTRSIYLANADVKQAQALVRTIAKTRDIHVDERLNLMVVRDSPETLLLIERIVANIDLPEPEVMLDVEVMEVASDSLDELGLQWPESIGYGLPGSNGLAAPATALLSQHRDFRASIANPALVAVLRGSGGSANLLANPSIRAKNREKAKVQVGEKLPVFTTTAIANVQGVSTTVSYVDVGLKLDVEPTVQLDNEVTMRIALEVTNLLGSVSGPDGSVAYNVGTRMTSTALRLKDGETQILAGLISDEDRRNADGVPGLSRLPLLGRLFGVQSDTRKKTEVVLLITPRVLRNLNLPSLADATHASGTEANPGALPLRLRPQARAGMAPSGAGVARASAAAAPAPSEAPPAGTVLFLEASSEAAPGATVAVTLRHDSDATLSGELGFDNSRLTTGAGGSTEGRIGFELGPRGQRALVLRVRPDAPPGPTALAVSAVSARGLAGEAVDVRVEGMATVQIVGPVK
ncbi:type II secretory pathway, component HofQ [Burkholderiales bacterium JOSHI_001]|nr:type II secretory pathway, component HofQ [Burkholderiales bacterium JOSHI_001]